MIDIEATTITMATSLVMIGIAYGLLKKQANSNTERHDKQETINDKLDGKISKKVNTDDCIETRGNCKENLRTILTSHDSDTSKAIYRIEKNVTSEIIGIKMMVGEIAKSVNETKEQYHYIAGRLDEVFERRKEERLSAIGKVNFKVKDNSDVL